MPITDTKARSAKPKEKPYKIMDAEGLYLEVRPTGKKIWRCRFYMLNKEGMFTIGQYPAVTLAAARKMRDWVKQQAREGLNPNDVRKQMELEERAARDNTFQLLASEYRRNMKDVWSLRHLEQYDALMKNDILPVVGHMPVAEIKPAHVLQVIEPVVARGAPSMAARCRMHMSKVFRLAAGRLLVESDPTHLLAAAIPKRPLVHYNTLPDDQIGKLLGALDEYTGRQTALGVKLLLHTFLRGAELRQASWSEVCFKKRIWTIPAAHMKKRRIHLVPLSSQSIDILKELHQMNGSNPAGLMFPKLSDPRVCMGKRTMDAAIEYMGFRGTFSLHGFRSAASTTLNEYGWHPDAIEKQLSHVEQKSERRAYNHAQYLDIRTEMMQWWSDYIEGKRGG